MSRICCHRYVSMAKVIPPTFSTTEEQRTSTPPSSRLPLLKLSTFSGPPAARNLIFSLPWPSFPFHVPSILEHNYSPHIPREGHDLTHPLFLGMRSYWQIQYASARYLSVFQLDVGEIPMTSPVRSFFLPAKLANMSVGNFSLLTG